MTDTRKPLSPEEIESALAAPFPASDVKFRPGATAGGRCLALAYVTARAVMDRLDAVLGVGGWQTEHRELQHGVVCSLRLKVGPEWVTQEDVGGFSEQPDSGDRLKAAYSDALKRVAVRFGIARYLYRLPGVWVDYDAQKKIIKSPPTLPAWALPARATAGPQKAAPPAQAPAAAVTKSDAAESTPSPQKRRESIAEALARKDAEFARAGHSGPGELLAFAHAEGVKASMPHRLPDWVGQEHVTFAARAVQSFLDAPIDAAQHAELRKLLAESGADLEAFCEEAEITDTNYLPRKNWPAVKSKLEGIAQNRRRAARSAG